MDRYASDVVGELVEIMRRSHGSIKSASETASALSELFRGEQAERVGNEIRDPATRTTMELVAGRTMVQVAFNLLTLLDERRELGSTKLVPRQMLDGSQGSMEARKNLRTLLLGEMMDRVLEEWFGI